MPTPSTQRATGRSRQRPCTSTRLGACTPTTRHETAPFPPSRPEGLKLKRQTPARQDRDAYDLDVYRIVLGNAAQYRKREPHKWWVTIACAFLGCRIEELAQAHVATDFARDDASGIHYLKVEEGVGDLENDAETSSKSVKSLSSWRRIPIHPALISAGFLRYLEHERAQGAVTPFGRYWSPQRDRETGGIKHSHPITKWSRSELKKLRSAHSNIPRNLTYFHSMRHGLTTLLAKAGVAEEWRAALAGHRTGGMNAQVYNKASQDVASTFPFLKAGLKPLAQLLREIANE